MNLYLLGKCLLSHFVLKAEKKVCKSKNGRKTGFGVKEDKRLEKSFVFSPYFFKLAKMALVCLGLTLVPGFQTDF